jgi:NAD(P)-dependent dehydrogenase (short-subunit alcohol dehydrogenase family)
MYVNAFGSFYCAKHELSHMVSSKEPGSIVFTSSTGGVMGFPLGCGYNCSKHAVIGLMKNIMCDYAEFGIRSNAICPSQSDTPMNDQNMAHLGLDEAGRAKFKRTRSPMRRLSKPEEIAAAVVFLLSDESSHVSGTTLMIDGGQSATNENYFNWD